MIKTDVQLKTLAYHVGHKNTDSICALQKRDAQLVLDRLLFEFDGYEFGWCCGGEDEKFL